MIAIELGRQPKLRSKVARHGYEQHQGAPDLARRFVNALRLAHSVGSRLSFSELCERAGCAPSGHAHELLHRLRLRGVVRLAGSGRATVYWAE